MLEKPVFVTNIKYFSRVIPAIDAFKPFMQSGAEYHDPEQISAFFRSLSDRVYEIEREYPEKAPLREIDGWKIDYLYSLNHVVSRSIF